MTPSGLHLLYGGNEPEPGFVWTEFEFGLAFAPGGDIVALLLSYPHQRGTLHSYNKISGARDYDLASGDNWIALQLNQTDQHFDFSVSPRRVLAQDVRELGVMLRHTAHFPTHSALLAGCPHANRGVASDWAPAERHLPGPLLARELLASYVGRGLFLSYLHASRTPPVLELAVFPPSWWHAGDATDIELSINNKIQTIRAARIPNPDSGHILAHVPNTAFRAFVDLSAHQLPDGTLPALDVEWTEDLDTVVPWQTMHWRGAGAGPVPPAENIFRVAGPAPPDFFLFSGATWYVKLIQIYENFMGRAFETCGPVLDFGIGCGRIARFFPPAAANLHGVDIDALNVAWCREHHPWIDTRHTTTAPPLPFECETFELIYGHSVMTHIAEADQPAWLRELARVTRPGGLCLLTIMAELSWFIRFFPAGRSAGQLEAFIRAGIIDDGALDVGVDAQDPGAYRNISHTSAYIRREWAAYFEVVTIIPGFADLQSLVVLRKRQA